MSLNQLISEYHVLETALIRSMDCDGTPRERARLLRKLADKLDELERYTPADEDEARDQIFFFTLRAVSADCPNKGGRDIEFARLLSRRGPRFFGEPPRKESREPAQANLVSLVSQTRPMMSC